MSSKASQAVCLLVAEIQKLSNDFYGWNYDGSQREFPRQITPRPFGLMECRSVLLESEKSVDIKTGIWFRCQEENRPFSTALANICTGANIWNGVNICAGDAAVVTGSVKGLFGHVCIHHVVRRDPFYPVLVTESQTVPDTHLATILFLYKTREN